jgi:ABC-2 type transport system permease protein
MSVYTLVFRARMRTLLRYRAAAWAGVVTQLVFGIVLIATRTAFYRVSGTTPPLTWEQMVTYSWLVQAFFAMSPYTATPDADLRKMIVDGSVAYELTRPFDLYTLWFARQVANRLAPTLLRCGPILLLGMGVLGMQPPGSIAALAAFLLAMAGALLLIATWSTLIVLSMLWTVSGDGLARLSPTVIMVCSGQLLPLAVYPHALRRLFALLPFRGMVDAPYVLWTGQEPPSAVALTLAHQLAWTAFFVLAGRFLLNRGLRRLVVQGG